MLHAQHLERDAASSLDAALALATTLHAPGQRERYRHLLERAIEQADRALAAAEQERAALQEHELDAGTERILATVGGAVALVFVFVSGTGMLVAAGP